MSVDTPTFDSSSISDAPRMSGGSGSDVQPEGADPRSGGYSPSFGSTPSPDVAGSPRIGGSPFDGNQVSDVVEPAAPRLSPGSAFDSPTQG